MVYINALVARRAAIPNQALTRGEACKMSGFEGRSIKLYSGFRPLNQHVAGIASLSRARKRGPMQHLVAVPAQCDQVSLRVVTEGASPSHMMNVQILERSTSLAAPTIARQDLLAQLSIRDGRCADSMALLQNRVAHVAFSAEFDGPYVADEPPMDAEDS
jgi:hypothetical protein